MEIPDQEHLATKSMIADRLGVARSTVSNWIDRHPTFPTPVVEVGSAAIYSMPQIEAWVAARNDEAETDLDIRITRTRNELKRLERLKEQA